MRHFAGTLRAEGLEVDYVYHDEDGNTGSFEGELNRALERHQVERVIVIEPSEWRVWEGIRNFTTTPGIKLEVRDDNRFLCSREDFKSWAEGRKTLRMEHFYRWIRRRTGLLMNGREPEGGNRAQAAFFRRVP